MLKTLNVNKNRKFYLRMIKSNINEFSLGPYEKSSAITPDSVPKYKNINSTFLHKEVLHHTYYNNSL